MTTSLQTLAQAIATAIGNGATVTPLESASDNEWRAIIKLDSGNIIITNRPYLASDKCEVSFHPHNMREAFGSYGCPTLPKCTFNRTRSTDSIARDFKRKLIDPGAPIVADVQARITAKNAARDKTAQAITSVRGALPWLKIEDSGQWYHEHIGSGYIDATGLHFRTVYTMEWQDGAAILEAIYMRSVRT